MYQFVRSLLFLLPAETAHNLTLKLLKFSALRSFIKPRHPNKLLHQEVEIHGLKFKNPVGLAAGLDKDAKVYRELGEMGFGFVEIGTLTPKPQSGNPKPRLFRLKRDHALINRIGFNNEGVNAAISRLKKKPENLIVGGNIGKNKTTLNTEAYSDYEKCFEELFPWVNYFTINISSPNTPNLRELQNKDSLDELLKFIQAKNQEHDEPKVIFVKIAPDLSKHQLEDIIELCKKHKINGIIATNTTISRTGLSTGKNDVQAIGDGGLSGKPLLNKSTEVVRLIREVAGDELYIIAAGGIMGYQEALEKMEAGADLLQVYTGFIYRGPAVVKEMLEACYDHQNKN